MKPRQRRNPVARDLRTPKYRQRIVKAAKERKGPSPRKFKHRPDWLADGVSFGPV